MKKVTKMSVLKGKLRGFKINPNTNRVIAKRINHWQKPELNKKEEKMSIVKELKHGIYENKLYKYDELFNGISTGDFDKDQKIFEKYVITEDLYQDYYAKDIDSIIPKHVLDKLGFYVDGNLFTGSKYGYTFKNGTTINGIYDGLLYKNGSVYTGSYQGRDFTDGVMDYVEELEEEMATEQYEFIYIDEIIKKYAKKIISFFKR